ncbi:MAG: transposase [Chloroflexi bacterium]|nr:transposase [Chloroflexota bacterium]
MSKIAELETIWEVPDELWLEIRKVLDELDPARGTGRPRVDQRRALDGIIYRLRSSCQWSVWKSATEGTSESCITR